MGFHTAMILQIIMFFVFFPFGLKNKPEKCSSVWDSGQRHQADQLAFIKKRLADE